MTLWFYLDTVEAAVLGSNQASSTVIPEWLPGPTVQIQLICEKRKKVYFCPVQPDGKVACAMNYKIITHSTCFGYN